jgi:hypothetical protein
MGKLSNHIGTLYGTDIGTESATSTKTYIKKPIHSIVTIQRHEDEEWRRKACQSQLQDALEYKANKLKAKADAKLAVDEDDSEEHLKIVHKCNEMEILQYEMDDDLPITLEG